jgi:hypothetical protein
VKGRKAAAQPADFCLHAGVGSLQTQWMFDKNNPQQMAR